VKAIPVMTMQIEIRIVICGLTFMGILLSLSGNDNGIFYRTCDITGAPMAADTLMIFDGTCF
jgi:hypothetical protein